MLVVCQLANSAASSCCDKCTEKSICLNGMDRNSFNFFLMVMSVKFYLIFV